MTNEVEHAYRPEIDGLRALAVIPVVLYHAGFAPFSGGFVGVDVFFVISGYLITGIIRADLARGAFSFQRFYQRRIRRILPALYLVVAACFPFAWLWLFPDELRTFANSASAVALFVSNAFFNRKLDYFSPDVDAFPLIHTWSLAVEEQFYLIFPVMLYLTRRRRPGEVFALVAVVSLASFALATWMSTGHPQSDFYLLPTRAWELGVGALCALASARRSPASVMAGLVPAIYAAPPARIRGPSGDRSALTPGTSPRKTEPSRPRAALDNILAAAGLALLTYAVFTFRSTMPLPGPWSLAPVAGSALILRHARRDTIVGALLGARPLVAIGLVSYSFYLWHQPLFAFARIKYEVAPASSALLGLGALALALAFVSWRWVERPFRDRAIFSDRAVLAGALCVGVGFVALARLTDFRHGFPDRFSADVAAIAASGADRNSREAECFGDVERFVPPEAACNYNAPIPVSIALWGDSHAFALAGALADALAPLQKGLRVFANPSCPPIRGLHFREAGRQNCPVYNDHVFAYLAAHPEIRTVILMARWSLYFESASDDDRDSGPMHLRALPPSQSSSEADGADRDARLGDAVRAQIDALLKLGVEVVLVYPVPEMGTSVPERIARDLVLHGRRTLPPISIGLDSYLKRSQRADRLFDALAPDARLARVRPEADFCGVAGVPRCFGEIDGKLLYRDDNHLNVAGNALVARRIVEAMEAAKGP